MTNDETNRAAAVAGATSPPQAADIRDRWWWVEHSVWTDRMLTRLEQSEPTTKTAGLRRRGCSVWNTAPVPMVGLTETPLTGEPDAGNPPVRFGGRGGANPAIPTSIWQRAGQASAVGSAPVLGRINPTADVRPVSIMQIRRPNLYRSVAAKNGRGPASALVFLRVGVERDSTLSLRHD